MIIKGNQRGGGQQLATHLLNEFDNDDARVISIENSVSPDLHGTFAEWRGLAKNTKCQKYLYSLSINPWEDVNGGLTPEQYHDFIGRVEAKLGLENQPRVIVSHTKYGREHAHVVWSRIHWDEEKEKFLAKHIDHDKQKLRSAVRQFAKDHDLELPEGMKNDIGVDRFNDAAKMDKNSEKQRKDRTGINKAEHQAIITKTWQDRGTPKQFVQSLETSGYYLSRGDKIPYAVVDRFGEVFSLAKMVKDRDVKTKNIRDFLGKDYSSSKLPHISKAQEYVLGLDKTKAQALKEEFRIKADELTFKLKNLQFERRKKFNKEVAATQQRHRLEASALKEVHFANNAKIDQNRMKRQTIGISAALLRFTGINNFTNKVYAKLDTIRNKKQEQQTVDLHHSHDNEKSNLQRRSRTMSEVEKREQRGLEAKLRLQERETMQNRDGEREEEGRMPKRKEVNEENRGKQQTRQRDRDRDL